MVSPDSLKSITDAMQAATGPVVFNVSPNENPFGVPTRYRRMCENLEDLDKATEISLNAYTGVIEHDADDQVVVVRAGTTVSELQAELAKVGQCLPMPNLEPHLAKAVASFDGALIDEIGFNLPHGLANQCGSWRDWILGLAVIQPDGTVVKCGSKAVKNVAGYDVQKLMIGARGTLGLIAEVTLKTYPLKALPKFEVEFVGEANCNWVQRVLPSDFGAAVLEAGSRITAFDRASSTLWASVPPNESLKRFEFDWVLRSGCGAKNLEIVDPTVIRLMKRAKELFDPENKMNPGEMGIL